MQTAGYLKKRRKRNISKITGVSVIQYDESQDIFDWSEQHFHLPNAKEYTHIASLGDGSLQHSSRVTRDPRYSVTARDDVEGLWTPLSRPSSYSKVQDKHKRPVLLSENHIGRLRHIMILGVASFSFPWSWNTKTHQIDKWGPFRNRLWKIMWTLLAIQSTCLTVFQLYSFFSRIQQDKTGSWRPVFMNSFSVLWYTYSVWLNILMIFYRESIRNYVNSMFALNKRLVDEYLLDATGHVEGGQVLLNVSIPTNITQTFISVSLFLTFPASPWYLYSYIYSPDVHAWYWLIPGALQEFAFAGQVIAVYLLIGWIIVAHANSVEFWLQEAHNHNDTEMTRDELRQPHKAIEVYRSLQVLTQVFNDAMAPLAIPMNKMISWTALIPCGYVLIRSMNSKFIQEFPGILTYPFGVIDCTTCVFGLLQTSGKMFDIAASFLNSWSQTRHKALRKILISCPVLKVKIGSLYVDEFVWLYIKSVVLINAIRLEFLNVFLYTYRQWLGYTITTKLYRM